jgi:hypothetical protein
MTTSNSSSPTFSSSTIFPSDHTPDICSLDIFSPSAVPLSKYLTHSIHSVSIESFIRDIRSSNLITHPPTYLSDLVDCCNSTLGTLQKKHAPVNSEILHPKPANHWFTPTVNKLKFAEHDVQQVSVC